MTDITTNYKAVSELLLEDVQRLTEQRDELRAALLGILEIGKRDMTNPKYDGYFDSARAAVQKAKARS